MNKTFFVLLAFLFLIGIPLELMSAELMWQDVYYTSGPYIGAQKNPWSNRNEEQKAAYLELHYKAIQYCFQNIGKQPKELDLSQSGPYIVNFPKITLEVVSMYYRMYGDLQKSAGLKYKYWVDSNHNPLLGYADTNPLDFVIGGYEEASMYKELVGFYPVAYDDMMRWLAKSTDIKLIKTDFKKYKQNWPEKAEKYQELMRNWAKAKKLAKTEKPNPLDPAVQNHEWFYSEKQEEVLKALEYYYQNKVKFMLEKALNHKDPVIAAKAKEYLESLSKVTGDETKH